MPLSDKDLALGNPLKQPLPPVDPFLGSAGGSPVSPETFFLDGKDKLKEEQGIHVEDWGKPIDVGKRVASPIIGVDELLANQRYKYYRPGADNEEISARGQSAWDRWGNSLYKMGATALGTFAQGFLTIPDTISAIRSGKISDLYQSDTENTIDRWLKNMEDDFPNYYSHYEQEHPFLSAIPFAPGSANFWGDKVFKNLGFTIGAIGSAVAQDAIIAGVTGGVGDIPLIGSQVGKASLWLTKLFTGTNKLEQVLETANLAEKTGKTIFDITKLGQLAAGERVGNTARYWMNLYGSARTEGGIEARDGYNTLKTQLIKDFKDKRGFDPQGEDLNRIEASSTASANVRFGINMALFTLSDAIQFDNFLRPYSAARKGVTAIEGGAIGLADKSLDVFEKVVPKSIGGRIWSKVQPVIPNILAEGVYEEGGQYAAQIGTYQYYKDKYNGKIKGGIDDILHATTQGLSAQFGSQEGIENMFLGAITAAISGGAMKIVGKGGMDAQTQSILSTLNNQTLTGTLGGNYADTAKSVAIKAQMDEAVKNRDIFTYQNLKHDMFYNFMQGAIRAGRFDVRIEQLKMLKELEQPQFEKMFGMDYKDENKRTVDSYVDELIQKANDIKSSVDSVNAVFTNPFRQPKDIAKTPEDVKEAINWQDFEEWKNEVSYFASFAKDSDNRITSMNASLARISPNLTSEIVKNVSNKKALDGLKHIYETRLSFAKDELESNEDPVVKAQRRYEIKGTVSAIENINTILLQGQKAPLDAFANLLQFESARSGTGNIIAKEKVPEILGYGHDLQQLEDRKQRASEAFDKLTNPVGYDRFIDSKRKLEQTPEAVPTAPIIPEINIKDKEGKNIPIQVGKTYSTTAIPTHSIRETPDGRWEVIDNHGRVVKTPTTKQGAEDIKKALDEVFTGRDRLTVQGINADGTIRVKDSKGDITDISVDELQGYERYISPEERLLEDKDLQAKLELDQSEAQKNSGDVITNEPNEAIEKEGKRKPIANISSNTDASLQTDPKEIPERNRHWALLNNIRNLPNRNNIRIITVTANNEQAVGMDGVIAYKMPNATTAQLNDADNAPILSVYVEQASDGVFFIDQTGKRIGKVGEKVDFNKAVFSTLSSTSLVNSRGEQRFVVKEGDKGSLEDYQRAWREKRAQFLALKDNYAITPFIVSRGVAEENVVDGRKESNPVVGTLVEEKDLDNVGLIEIPTQEFVIHQGNQLKFPNGRPILKNKDTVQFLNNRLLTKEEASTIFDVLRSLAKTSAKTGHLNRQALNFLQGILYFGYQKGKDAKRNQVYIKDGYLHLGKDLRVPFFEDSLNQAGPQIIDHLLNTYNNVNNHYLKKDNFNTPFEEITGVNPDGTFKSVIWKNYQHYLLSPTYSLDASDTSGLKGIRQGVPLSTTVRKRVDENDYNFSNKYSTLTGLSLDVKDTRGAKPIPTKKLDEKKQNPQAPVVVTQNTTDTPAPAIVQVGNVVFDGKTPNIYTTKGGLQFPYLASINSDGKVNISINTKDDRVLKAIGVLMHTARGTLKTSFGIDDPRYEKMGTDEEAAIVLMSLSAELKATAAMNTANSPQEKAASTPIVSPTEAKIETGILNEKDIVQFLHGITDLSEINNDKKVKEYVEKYLAPLEEFGMMGLTLEDIHDYANNRLQSLAENALINKITGTTIQGTPRADDILSKPDEDIPDEEISNFRMVTTRFIEVVKENWPKVEAWMKANLPQVPVKRVNTLIKATGGGYAWGVFRDAALEVYENAEEGTTYHEAFHNVWNMFNTRGERIALVREFRNREEGNKNLSEGEIEERLAEEFRDFILTGKVISPTKSKGILGFFKDLLNTIVNFILNRPSIEQLFRRINTGYYKEAPLNRKNVGEKYSIANAFNEQISREILHGVSSRLIQNIFKEGKSLVELEEKIPDTQALYSQVYEELRRTYEVFLKREALKHIQDRPNDADLIKLQYEQYLKVWEDIKNNWDKIVKANNDFLRTYGLVNEEKTGDEGNEEENLNNDNKQGRSDDYLRDTMRIDSKKNASTAIKLLFATLIETNKPNSSIELPSPKYSSIHQYELVNFAKAFNHVMHTISNTNTLNEMVKKMRELAGEYSNFVRLFTRLKGDMSTGEIAYDKLEVDDWKLLMKFYNVFAKQKPRALIQIIDEGGNSYTVNANFGDAIKSTVNEWIDNIKSLSKQGKNIVQYNRSDKVYEVDPELMAITPSRTTEDRIEFLRVLGIPFTIDDYNKLPPNSDIKDDFDKASTSIFSVLKNNPRVMTVQGRTLGISGPLNTLAEIFIKTNGNQSESTFYNADGERVQGFVQNNYPSLFTNDFNSVSSLAELLMKLPYLADVWSENSVVLKQGGRFFDKEGNRTSTPLELGYIDGTVNMTRGGKGKQTSKLSLAERRLQELNQNLMGRYYTMVPADSKTEWFIPLGNFIEFRERTSNGVWNKIYGQFHSYLETELWTAIQSKDKTNILNLQGRANKLRFFGGILTGNRLVEAQKLIDDEDPEGIESFINNNSTGINEDVRRFIDDESKYLYDYLLKFNILQIDEKGNYRFVGLDENFTGNNSIGEKLSKQDVYNILSMRTINYMVANIEQHKLLFGDPALIKDPTKRHKSFLSGTETAYHDNVEFDNFANVKLNEGLKSGDVGYHVFKNHMVTVTAKDINVEGTLYPNSNEADSQTWMKDTTYRELMWKHGRWDDAHEIQHQYEMAWTRDYLDKRGDIKYSSPELKERDRLLLEKGNPGIASFHIIKPKGSGQKQGSTFLDPYLDKTSAAPVYLRLVTLNGTINSNFVSLYNQMQKQEVGYVIVQSGRKVGAEGLHSLYNDDGSFNTNDFDASTIINIPFKNYGIQQETASSGKKQTLGSQLTKLATMDLMSGGMPLDYKEGFTKWDALSEEQKLSTSPMYQKIKKNQTLLEELAQDGYERLLRKLGVVDSGNGFITVDKERLAGFLQGELLRREIDENAKAGISINLETGDFTFPLEANPKYTQIKNILYSIVDKQIASPKVNGGAKIEMSASMWEQGNRETRNGKIVASKNLKFYTKEDPYMEVMLPHWFGEALKAKGIDVSDEQLMKQLRGSDVLKGIGFRIPTQKLSSIDVIRIVGFLPKEMGDTIIVPAELATKAGSDFDVDKLNTYLANVEVDRKGRITTVQHQGTRENTIEYYTKKFNKLLAEKQKNTSKFLEAVQFALYDVGDEKVFKQFENLLNDVMDDNTEENTIRALEKLDEKSQAKIRDAYVNRMYTQAIENAYFKSLEELLTLPENFERLTSPNSDKTLKGLRNELRELKYTKEEIEKTTDKDNHSLLISPSYMSEMRHNFMIGKGGVGIVAVGITNHSLNQRSNIYVNRDKLNEIGGIEGMFLGDGVIKMRHNQIVINGKSVASLSGIKDQNGDYISDKLSEYANGYVDISKDTFIIEIGATTNALSTFLFLEKIGVPTRDVVMFMNQPIIQEFMEQLSIKGWSNLTNLSIAEAVRGKFNSENYVKLGVNDTLNVGGFENNIRKYFKDKDRFTDAENVEQLQILDEFLKYAVMANHLSEVIQGSNYDTANFNDPNLLIYKFQQTQTAMGANIISSVSDILNNSFIGKRARLMFKSRNMLAEAVPIRIERYGIRGMLDVIKRVFGQKGTFISERDRLRIARGVETSFMDYLVQTKLKLNGRINDVMLDAEKSVATELHNLKQNLSKKKYSDIANNPILKELIPSPSDRENGPKNVRLNNRDNDAFTSNLYTGALRELRENVHTQFLYKRLVRLSLLQSGLRQTPSSFGHLIPVEDYAAILGPLFEKMDTFTDLENFMMNNAFFRNYWKDDSVVPRIKPKFFDATDYNGAPYFEVIDNEVLFQQTSPIYYMVPSTIRDLRPIGNNNTNFIALSDKYNGGQLKFPVVKVEKLGIDPSTGFEYTPSQKAQMRKMGNYSYMDVTLYAKVLDREGMPLRFANKDGSTSYIFKHINAWGDGQNAQEYYEDGRPSLYDNGATKNTLGEIHDGEIEDAFEKWLEENPIRRIDKPKRREKEQTQPSIEAFTVAPEHSTPEVVDEKDESTPDEIINFQDGTPVKVKGEEGTWYINTALRAVSPAGYIQVSKSIGDSESLEVSVKDITVVNAEEESKLEGDYEWSFEELEEKLSPSLVSKIDDFWKNNDIDEINEYVLEDIYDSGKLSLDEATELRNFIDKEVYREEYNPAQTSIFDKELIDRLEKAGIIKKDC